MYTIDGRDTVVVLEGFPAQTTYGELLVIANDLGGLVVAYDVAPDADEVAILRFNRPRAHYLGPPNDEALGGHPLAVRGLKWWEIHEVKNSSWIRSLERMNRVHPGHSPSLYNGLRHFVITSKEVTFECVASDLVLFACFPKAEAAESILGRAAAWLGTIE
jgi:hypothetical protein